MKSPWYKAKVLHGDKIGRKMAYPTINLAPTILESRKEGVYAVTVRYKGNERPGALYFGPRLVKKEDSQVLEINIFDFDKDVYGAEIEFRLGQYIRGVMDFDNLDELKKQIEKDVEEITRLIGGSAGEAEKNLSI
ncbi:MAG: riboflavin kinase [bacterium]|nr:riboflavin kinase [bacterium]